MMIDASSTPVPVTKADTNRKVKVRHLQLLSVPDAV